MPCEASSTPGSGICTYRLLHPAAKPFVERSEQFHAVLRRDLAAVSIFAHKFTKCLRRVGCGFERPTIEPLLGRFETSPARNGRRNVHIAPFRMPRRLAELRVFGKKCFG